MSGTWSPDSWRSKHVAQSVPYDDPEQVNRVVARLATLPPLVTSFEIERLKVELAEAQAGKRFVLQGGDCAEQLSDCRSPIIANKLKILLQMSVVLIHAAQRPITRIGRFAGQYAKPRSSPVEVRNGQELTSYFGDIVNRPEFTEQARRPDPGLMLEAYYHAALTLNFIRSLTAAGFADVQHPEYWRLDYFRRAAVPPDLLAKYEHTTRTLTEALRFMAAFGEGVAEAMSRVDFYASHEGLHLLYEAAQTVRVPRRVGYYDLSTHLPWIGERTRALDGAHVEFFRGIRNPVGVKIGPKMDPGELVRLVETLNPDDEPGKLVLITRMGCKVVSNALPPLVEAVSRAGRRVLWMADPMHGNTQTTRTGIKTRRFDDILEEIERTFAVHDSLGSKLGGIHFELTGEDVTECLGGAAALSEENLDTNYQSACDPRLNYGQALEMSFRVADHMRGRQRPALRSISTRPEGNW